MKGLLILLFLTLAQARHCTQATSVNMKGSVNTTQIGGPYSLIYVPLVREGKLCSTLVSIFNTKRSNSSSSDLHWSINDEHQYAIAKKANGQEVEFNCGDLISKAKADQIEIVYWTYATSFSYNIRVDYKECRLTAGEIFGIIMGIGLGLGCLIFFIAVYYQRPAPNSAPSQTSAQAQVNNDDDMIDLADVEL